jgi:AcrR family transcriptional regulator
MPTETFFNLNLSKRDQFTHAALQEFATHDFASASVSRIVAMLGIAKGSVYQYFEDKQDLYLHLLELAAERKLQFIRERVEALGGGGDFRARQTAVILAGAEFDFQNPLHGLLLLKALREPRTRGPCERIDELRRRSTRFLQDSLREGICSRVIRADLDPRLMAELLNAAMLAVAPFMEEKYGFSLSERLEHPEKQLPFTGEQLRADVDALMDAVFSGIEQAPDS